MENYSSEELYKRQINLYLEANPNPNAMKFVVNFMLFDEGETFDYANKDEANPSPLATALFTFPYVTRVFFMNNFITITKTEEVSWEEIKNELKTFLKEYLEADKPIFHKLTETKADNKQVEPEIEIKIKNILDEYVKPAVEQDGGAIIFDSFDSGTVKVLLQGSCSGCPSSTLTLKAGIENLLKSMLPEVQAVEAESV